ncbi:MAG: ABC transporter permease [Bacilli bacterium]
MNNAQSIESAGGFKRALGHPFLSHLRILIPLLLLCLVFSILSPYFFTVNNLFTVILESSITSIVASGQALVIMTGGIDLSVGSIMALTTVIVGEMLSVGLPLPLVIVAALVSGSMIGLINGILITRGKIAPFIATLGTYSAINGLALIVSNATPIPVENMPLMSLGSGYLGPVPIASVVTLIVVAAAHILLRHNPFGTYVLAIGGSEQAAKMAGIHTRFNRTMVYVLCSLLATVGGIILTGRLGSAEPTAGGSYMLDSVAAVVMGGVSLFGGEGSIVGPVLGSLILGVLLNGLSLLGVSSNYQPIAEGVVIVLAVLMGQLRKRR